LVRRCERCNQHPPLERGGAATHGRPSTRGAERPRHRLRYVPAVRHPSC
jgi:hypothetical protein